MEAVERLVERVLLMGSECLHISSEQNDLSLSLCVYVCLYVCVPVCRSCLWRKRASVSWKCSIIAWTLRLLMSSHWFNTVTTRLTTTTESRRMFVVMLLWLIVRCLVRPSVCLSLCLSVCLPVHPSVRPSVCLTVCLSVVMLLWLTVQCLVVCWLADSCVCLCLIQWTWWLWTSVRGSTEAAFPGGQHPPGSCQATWRTVCWGYYYLSWYLRNCNSTWVWSSVYSSDDNDHDWQ